MRKIQQMKQYIKKCVYFTMGLSALAAVTAPNPVQAELESYQVKDGDTLFGISKTFGKSIGELANLNNLSETDKIQQGDTVVIGESADGNYFNVNALFIENIGKSAREIANENGLYASVMVAQAILESNYGQSVLAAPPYHNLFGIKGSYQGESVVVSTNEYLNNQWVIEQEQFRSYPGYYASLVNNARVLRGGNSWSSDYYRGAWKENTTHYTDATEWLESRYATDPNYGKKLNNIIQRYNLTKYDEATPKQVVRTNSATATPTTTDSSNTNDSTYLVTNGDTLYNVAKRYGMSVQSLKQLNQIQSNVIKTGQRLRVSGEVASTSESTHTVQAGDTLYNISQRYGMTVMQLKANNQKSTDKIRLGEKLSVKASDSSSDTHTVQNGDTLFNIAKRYDTTVNALKALNQLQSNRIKIGQTINY